MPGLSLKSKGSRFGRVCSIQDRRVRSLVAWAFLKSKSSKFKRVCSFQGRRVRGFVAWAVLGTEGFEGFRFELEGFEVWSSGNFLKSKGSKFGCVCSIQDRRVRGFVAWAT